MEGRSHETTITAVQPDSIEWQETSKTFSTPATYNIEAQDETQNRFKKKIFRR